MQSITDILTQQIQKIRELVEEGACIVVEGKRDEETLRALGIDATFYRVSGSNRSLEELAHEISEAESEAIILTDFDKKGAILASKITEKLHQAASKARVNLQMRRQFMNCMTKTKVGEIQDLGSLLPHIKGDDIYGENWSSSNKICNKSKNKRKWRSRKA